ncbi:hypothetical protein SCP_0312610 [Sparassis crispa]|uniref:Uncharacterized protein n=1 Tax=Sparassis crispa TaxID=139825 RepID=A0A401GH93_9APHY|nr:hypothetical protein SCP_0312610 [Sparassis crispa]GBE81532.1 hypothetical protein SCP_0312610 [Sparassis crispa]
MDCSAALRGMMEYIEPIYYYPQYSQHDYYHECNRPPFSPRRATGAEFISRPPPSRRSHTSSVQEHRRREEQPWDHMAQTYAWVLEQEIVEMAKKNEETVQWVHKQQDRDRHRDRGAFRVFGDVGNSRIFLEQVHSSEFEADIGGSFQDSWRTTLRRHRNRERMVQEEVRRIQASRLETERCRRVCERRKLEEEARVRMENERAKARRDDAEREAWNTYEDRWTTLGGDSSEPLSFRDIPWPMVYQPQAVAEITPGRIVMFLLSPLHSDTLSRKDRIRKALRRWHPDRLVRVLARVAEDDKAKVEEGVGVVVRCLNNLLERES